MLAVYAENLVNDKAKDDKGRTYGLAVADTYLVRGDGQPAELLTMASKRGFNDVAYNFDDADVSS